MCVCFPFIMIPIWLNYCHWTSKSVQTGLWLKYCLGRFLPVYNSFWQFLTEETVINRFLTVFTDISVKTGFWRHKPKPASKSCKTFNKFVNFNSLLAKLIRIGTFIVTDQQKLAVHCNRSYLLLTCETQPSTSDTITDLLFNYISIYSIAAFRSAH